MTKKASLDSIYVHKDCREGGCLAAPENPGASKLTGPLSVGTQSWAEIILVDDLWTMWGEVMSSFLFFLTFQ